jgi:hypothetical protein
MPANRFETRAALLGAISADGSSLKPMVISPRKPIEIALFESGFTPANAMSVHRERGFVDRTLFQLWANRVLFSGIERR